MSGIQVQTVEAFGGVEGVCRHEVLGADGTPHGGPRVAIVGLMHGNEPVGAQVLDRLASVVDERLISGTVFAVRANLAAAELDLRHTSDGCDMNRLWDRDRLDALADADPSTLGYEERRARELAPVLLDCEVVLDLHSTSRPSVTHLVLRDDLAHADWAARLGVRRVVTGVFEGAILDGGICSNVGLRAGESSDRLGFTLEAGQHSDPKNLDAAWQVVVRLLAELKMWSEPVEAASGEFEVFEVIDRFRQAPRGAVPYRFVGYEGGEAGSERHGPVRKLESFEAIEADELILRRGSGTAIRSQAPFTMLMPTPTADPGTDLYYVTQRRHLALRARPRTDESARSEAEAIERVLDMLADDDFEQGTTWVTFDPRRTLDVCAEVVGRTQRLPRDDPHRRISVVGRGDWGGDEAERRNGKRYRQAMRRAVSDGVPLDRMQLMRGAAFGWFDFLTSSRLVSLVGRESDRRPLRLLVSLRQPHTVSMLVLGDLERALQEGDRRHARVAMVVEAATIEPDGPQVRTQISRAGLFGSRPELLRVAASLLSELRSEHQHLVRRSASGTVGSELDGLLDDDGALSPRSPEQVEVMRRFLYRHHLRSWCDLLAGVVTEPRRLANDEELGRWLARTMTAAGILDARSLKRLLVRKDGRGYRVDPGLLREIASGREELPRTDVPRAKAVPRQVDAAEDVDRDNIERWIGWKRFVRQVHLVPATRGKDVDLAFHDADIGARVARWYRDIRRLSAEQPGQWMIVVAGDGHGPDPDSALTPLVEAQRAVLLDPNVRYLRIQHMPGTHFGWMKAYIALLGRRPARGEPVSMCWEGEHGSSVNVVLLARRSAVSGGRPWSLEDWSVERCGVVLTDQRASHDGGRRVAMFTEPMRSGKVNFELIHFGRGHCEGLLKQASWRLEGWPGPSLRVALDTAVIDLLAGWIARVRRQAEALDRLAEDERLSSVVQLLGLRDPDIASALLSAAESHAPPRDSARAIWRAQELWVEEQPADAR